MAESAILKLLDLELEFENKVGLTQDQASESFLLAKRQAQEAYSKELEKVQTKIESYREEETRKSLKKSSTVKATSAQTIQKINGFSAQNFSKVLLSQIVEDLA